MIPIRTPFEQWFITIAADEGSRFPRVLKIPMVNVVFTDSFPVNPDPASIYAVVTEFANHYYGLFQAHFITTLVHYKGMLYHSFQDEITRIPLWVNNKYRIMRISHANDLMDLITIRATDDDYFVYTHRKHSFRDYRIRDFPTLLGNFIAAEKLLYHQVLTTAGLMHPSTRVYYGTKLFRLLTQSLETTRLQQKFSQEILQRMGWSGTKYAKRIMKLPFSSSSLSVEFATQRHKLFSDPFFEYGCIIQDTNLMPRHNSRMKEIRCMVVDGNLVCGIILTTFRRLQYQIRLFEMVENDNEFVKSPCVDVFLNVFEASTTKTKNILEEKRKALPHIHPLGQPKEKRIIDQLEREVQERDAFVAYIMDFLRLLEENFLSLSRMVHKSFHVFNNIRIREPLPITMEAIRQGNITRKMRADDVSNKICIERFLSDPLNYVERPFHERFLRVDLMYWSLDNRFYVNEIETYACGKGASPNEGFYNDSIYSLIHARLAQPRRL